MSEIEKKENSVTNTVEKSLTAEDVDIVAQRATNDPSIKVLEYSVSPYSSEAFGALGSYWSLKITMKSSNKDIADTLSFFVKSVPLDCKQSLSDFMKESQVFKEESHFFEKIFPFLTENYQGQKWSPICYLVKKDALIMEDLKLKGYKVRERFFDQTDNLKATLRTVAQFHSCSIIAEVKINTPLNKYYPHSFKDKIYCQEGFIINWHLSSFSVVTAIAKSLDRDTEKLKKTFDLMYDLVKPSSKHRNVVCHMDLWPNNMMFNDVSECVLLDFQTITYAPLVLDILKFLYLNTTREYRDKNERCLIEYYYSVLKETMKINDTTQKIEIPTLEDVLTAYNDLRLFGVISACLYFPDILIDRDFLKEALKNEDLVVDKVKFTFDIMEKDAWFKNRLEQAVVELSEHSENSEKIT